MEYSPTSILQIWQKWGCHGPVQTTSSSQASETKKLLSHDFQLRVTVSLAHVKWAEMCLDTPASQMRWWSLIGRFVFISSLKEKVRLQEEGLFRSVSGRSVIHDGGDFHPLKWNLQPISSFLISRFITSWVEPQRGTDCSVLIHTLLRSSSRGTSAHTLKDCNILISHDCTQMST